MVSLGHFEWSHLGLLHLEIAVKLTLKVTLPNPTAAASAKSATAPGPEIGFPADYYDPPSTSYPAQVVIYYPNQPTVIDATAISTSESPLEILLPLPKAPPPGTPVQVIIYTPGEPTVHQGTALESPGDGSIPIQLD
jgi:hypothetical protein